MVGKRFTVVIPRSLRKKLELKEGQQVIMRLEEGRLIIEPLPTDPYRVLERVISEPYNERKDEKRAKEWLEKNASH
jgi:AbrB family looped-hinge helix DNA binding protein